MSAARHTPGPWGADPTIYPLPFGGVAFNHDRRGSDKIPHGDALDAPSNGERACDGHTALALFAALGDPTGARSVLEDISGEINLTEAPEEALSDLLANLMHYCHREGISFYDALSAAYGHFGDESGGAVL